MANARWISFAETVEFLESPSAVATEKISIFHKRESYVETLWEGIVLVSRRRVTSALQCPTFSFLPHESKRQLVTFSKHHFLSAALRRFANLSSPNWHRYTDAAGKIAAERIEQKHSYENETEITLRRDILDAYCGQHRLVAVWVINATRFSERTIEEFDVPSGRKDVSGATFCYFRLFKETPTHTRPLMNTLSLIRGKRVVFTETHPRR